MIFFVVLLYMRNKILLIPGTLLAFFPIGSGIYIGFIPLVHKLTDGDIKNINLSEVAFSLLIPASISTFVLAHKRKNAAYLLLNGVTLFVGPISTLFRTQN